MLEWTDTKKKHGDTYKQRTFSAGWFSDWPAGWLVSCFALLDADLVSILLPPHRGGNISSFTTAPPPSFVDLAGAFVNYGLREPG